MNDCPSLLELTTNRAAHTAHIATCQRCMALLAAFHDDPGDEDLTIPEPEPVRLTGPRVDVDAAPTAGAVHGVERPGTGELLIAIVFDVRDAEVELLPTTPDVRFAAEHDVLIGDAVLGYRAAVQAWNGLHVLPDQLTEQITVLESELHAALGAARSAALRGTAMPAGLTVGPRILSDADPRNAFHDAEAERATWYEGPWRRLQAGDTLGPVVRAARLDQEVEPAELAERLDLDEQTIVDLESDEADVGQIPLSRMVGLIRTLDLPEYEPFFALVTTAVFENDTEHPYEQGVQFTRRRSGRRSAGGKPPEAVRRAHAQKYVSRLRAELERR